MFSTIISAAIFGMQIEFVRVEADTSNGLPLFHMVGYLSSEVKEAGERVRTAIKNSGFLLAPKKTVINLSPAHVRKRGTSFDLPIAVAILSSMNIISDKYIKEAVMLGELGLDGTVRKVAGVLPVVDMAQKKGYSTCVVPIENLEEAQAVKGIEILGVSSLREVCDLLSGKKVKKRIPCKNSTTTQKSAMDFSHIKGQEIVKRAAEIAASGEHHILLVGPPGGGKTMIGECMATILPKPEWDECMEITKVYSVAGHTCMQVPLITIRPFRKVHHTISKSALLGGGNPPAPGELSLASKGVLMIDELAECKRHIIECLRQPIEEGIVRVHRSKNTYVFPADCMIVAAMNPCPCGHYPNLNKCKCTMAQVQQYKAKLSAPFLDRIDLCVEVPKMEYDALSTTKKVDTSEDIRKRVEQTRQIQKKRFQHCDYNTNGRMKQQELEQYCVLDREAAGFLKQAYEIFGFTARTYHKVLKVARTIADMERERNIRVIHLKEAIGYRIMEEGVR